jgi:HEAT repeat protein
MKKTIVLLTVLTLIALVVPMMAKESILAPNANKVLVEDNLLFGLLANNTGLQRSCALMLGKIQSYKAVIPLMAVFSYNSDENVRIAAAWALCKIGDVRGVNAVKRAIKYDECPRVQAICALYYTNYERKEKFSFAQPEEIITANTQ